MGLSHFVWVPWCLSLYITISPTPDSGFLEELEEVGEKQTPGYVQGKAPWNPNEVGEAHKQSHSIHHQGRAVATDTQRNMIQAEQVLGNTGLRHELIFSPTWDRKRHHLLTEMGCA